MLSPVYLSSCADDILKLYNDLNDAIIRDIVRRLVNLDFDISQTAVWQMEKLQEVGGMVYEDALWEISKMTGKTEKELKRLFEDAGTESMSFDNSVYRKAGLTPLPLSQSPAMLEILVAGYRKCKGELKNLTLTTANMSQSVFINACNSAYMQVASGAFSQNTAIMNAIETIGNSGSWVLYPSGHRDRVDVAVRRNVQTGIGQTCGQMQIQQLDDMMWDVVDVTAHMGARPEHAQWQGGRFSYKGRNKKYPDFIETTGYGSVDGLLGAWCRHNFYPAIDGTPRAYSKEQIDEWNNHKVTYNGVEYSDREALDIQRAKERGLRATKRELVALDEAIKTTKDEALKKELSDDFGRISVKLNKQESSLNDFLDQTGFKKDYSRSQIKEFNRSMSGKVKAAMRPQETERSISGKRKNNTTENAVNMKMIDSKEFKAKFDSLPFDEVVNDSIYKQAKAILKHRNGTYFEDLYLLDSQSGKVLARSYSGKVENETSYSNAAKKVITDNPDIIIAIHNHGTNNPPTGSDFVSAGRRKYKNGIVVCHNGDIYIYKAGNKPFSSKTFGRMVDNFMGKGYNEKEAIVKTLNYYVEQYGIEWRKV